MKTLKKISALLLVLMLMASFSITAMADDEPAPDAAAPAAEANATPEGAKASPEAESGGSVKKPVINGRVYVDPGRNEVSITKEGVTYSVEFDSSGQGSLNGETVPIIKESGTLIKVNIASDIDSRISDGWDGILVQALHGSSVEVNIADQNDPDIGNIYSAPGIYTAGITSAATENGYAKTTTAGDVIAENGNGVHAQGGMAASTFSSGSSGTVIIETHDITADGIGITAKALTGGKVTVTADNVTSTGDTGIIVKTDEYDDNKVTITVGTEKSDSDGVVTGGVDLSAIKAGDVSVTIWKVDGPVTGDDAVIEKVMNYFVRYEDKAVENGSFNVEGDPSVLNGSDSVELTLTPADGYEVDTVYYNQGDNKTISKNENGKYILKPDATGGIKLWATFKLPDPPKPDPKPTPAPVFAPATYKLKFDLDGGVLPDGKTELELKCSAGQKITLPEAPTREGFTFAGWETTVRGKTVILDAGAKFTVTAAKTFVALWEEA